MSGVINMKAKFSKMSSAATAVLFLTLALGAVPVMGEAVTVGTGVEIDVLVDGQSIVDSGTVWWSTEDASAKTVTVRVANGGPTPIDLILFGMQNVNSEEEAFEFQNPRIAGNPFNPAWAASSEDTEDTGPDGTPDSVVWERPADSVGCGILPDTPCSEGLESTHGPVDFIVDLVPLQPAHLVPQQFTVAYIDEDGGSANLDAFDIGFGIDGLAPESGTLSLRQQDLDSSGTIEAGEMVSCAAGDGSSCILLDYSAADADSGIASVQLQVFLPDVTGWLNVDEASTEASGTFEYLPARIGPHSFRIVATDNVGHSAELGEFSVDLEPPASQVHQSIDTTIDAVSDPFNRVGQQVTLTVKSLVSQSAVNAKNVKVEITETCGSNAPSTLTVVTGSTGTATLSRSRSDAIACSYEAEAIQQLGPSGFSDVAEQGDLAGRQAEIVWTRLVASGIGFADGQNVVNRGGQLTPQVSLTWEHDGSPATGLLSGDDTLGFRRAGTGAGDFDSRVAETPASGTQLGAWAAESDGLYELDLTHGAHESITLSPVGTIIGYTIDDDDVPTSFQVTGSVEAIAHWVGVFVDGPLVVVNVDDADDPTPFFVNEEDEVQISATLRYTGNFDPSAQDMLNAGSSNVLAVGATASLFETSFLDAGETVDIESVDEATATATDGNNDGIVVFTVHKDTFSQENANTYGVEVLPVSALGGDIQQDFATSDRADYGASVPELTFTGVTYVLDAAFDAVAAGIEDVDDDLWWMDADTPGAEDSTDAITFSVHGTFSHDGSDAAGATVGAFWGDGTPLLALDGEPQLTALASPEGVATFTIDPDAFLSASGEHDLDYAIHTLVFAVISAPEPGLEGVITYDAGAFEQDVLWTRIHTVIEPNGAVGAIDDELSVGQDTRFNAQFYWYHDAAGNGGAYGIDGFIDAADAVDVVGSTIAVTDAVADAAVDDAGDVQQLVESDADRVLTIARGCADVDCTAGDLAKAAWHNFEVSLDGSANPHGISSGSDSIDILWTGVLLDAVTDELVVEAGQEIEVTVSAYFAHKTNADGSPLADRTFDRAVTYELVDLEDDSAVVTDTFTGTAEPVSLSSSAAGHRNLVAQVTDISDPEGNLIGESVIGTPSDIRVGSDSATLERVWLSLEIDVGLDTDNDGTVDAYVDDLLHIRGSDVSVYAQVVVDDGEDQEVVTGAFGGYTYDRQDIHPADSSFDRTDDPVAFPSTLSLLLTGTESVNTLTENLALSYDDEEGIWIATIPGADHLLPESDISYSFAASLQVMGTEGDGLVLSDSVADAFELDYTAVQLGLVGSVGEDGALWRNLGDIGELQVTAEWAHDDNDPASGATFGLVKQSEDATQVLVLGEDFTISETGTPGLYDVDILGAEAGRGAYSFFVTEVPHPDDAAKTFADADLDEQNMLTYPGALVQEVIFTAVVFEYGGSVGDEFLNRAEGTDIGYRVSWLHDPLYPFDHPTAWTFGDAQSIADRESENLNYAEGDVHLVSSQNGAQTLAPVYDTESFTPNGITASVVPETNPTITWTEIVPSVGTLSPATAVTDTDPDGGTSPVFLLGTPVEQAFTFALALEGDPLVADDSDVLVGGVAESTVAGQASTLFTSQNAGWFQILGMGLSTTAPDGKTITATQEATQWIGFE